MALSTDSSRTRVSKRQGWMISTVAGCKNRGIAGTAKLVNDDAIIAIEAASNRQLRIGYGPNANHYQVDVEAAAIAHRTLSITAIASRRWICMLQTIFTPCMRCSLSKYADTLGATTRFITTISHFYHG